MKVVAVVAAAACMTLVPSVVAATTDTPPIRPAAPQQPQYISLWQKVCQKRVIVHTRSIPANAEIQMITVAANGHRLRGPWLTSALTVEFSDRGVIVDLFFVRRAGRATVRMASNRDDCVIVHVLASYVLLPERSL